MFIRVLSWSSSFTFRASKMNESMEFSMEIMTTKPKGFRKKYGVSWLSLRRATHMEKSLWAPTSQKHSPNHHSNPQAQARSESIWDPLKKSFWNLHHFQGLWQKCWHNSKTQEKTEKMASTFYPYSSMGLLFGKLTTSRCDSPSCKKIHPSSVSSSAFLTRAIHGRNIFRGVWYSLVVFQRSHGKSQCFLVNTYKMVDFPSLTMLVCRSGSI